MGVCGMRNSPLVRCGVPSFALRIVLRPGEGPATMRFTQGNPDLFGAGRAYTVQPVIDTYGLTGAIRMAKGGEYQRSTPPQELPIGRAASIRTCLLSRKLKRPQIGVNFLAGRLYDQVRVNDSFQ